jgi:hypothetical protein
MTDIPGPSEDFQAELARVAAKPEVASPKPPKTPKPKRQKEFTVSHETPDLADPALDAAHAFTAEIRHMTTKDARALVSVGKKPKPAVEYSPAIVDTILSLMADGMMLIEICERDDMPNMSTITRWRWKFPDFDAQLSRAREALGDQFAWEVRRVADDANPLTAAADRVKMDAYRWLAAKMYPKQYGDKTTTELTGTVVHETKHVIDATMLSDDNIERLEEVLRAAQALPAPDTEAE